MQIWDGLESIVKPFAESSVAIGVFDGVHRGHQALIQTAVRDAEEKNHVSIAFTFDRHPAELFAPDKAPAYLSTPEQRIHRIALQNPTHLVIARFDDHLRSMTADEFLNEILLQRLGAKTIVVGDDFRFGQNQSGDVNFLSERQEQEGYVLQVVPPVLMGGERVSSTWIRTLVRGGQVIEAQNALNYPYTLSGTVVEGQQLGRVLGFPTANLNLSVNQVVPQDGIYAVWVYWRGQKYKGACSIGMRPTVGGTHRTIETFLLNFNENLYGETLEFAFIERLRDELMFDSLEDLYDQIARDVAQVEQILEGQQVL